jgi:heat shock protein HtpX
MSTTPYSLLDRVEENRRLLARLRIIPALLTGLVIGGGVAVLAAWWLGAVGCLVGLAVAVLLGTVVYLYFPKLSESEVRKAFLEAGPASEELFPRYHNLMESLTIGSGVPKPTLHVLVADGLNLAVYGPEGGEVVVATTALLAQLDRIELEGVLAAALVRIASLDAQLGTQLASRFAGTLIMHGPSVGPTQLTPGKAHRRAAKIAAALGEQRDLLADLGAVDITRYPPGLGSALAKIEARGSVVDSATWGTAHCWLVNPLPSDGPSQAIAQLNEAFGEREKVSTRVALMAEL